MVCLVFWFASGHAEISGSKANRMVENASGGGNGAARAEFAGNEGEPAEEPDCLLEGLDSWDGSPWRALKLVCGAVTEYCLALETMRRLTRVRIECGGISSVG